MESDLFPQERAFRSIRLASADVSYLGRMDLGQESSTLMRRLIDEVPWRAENVIVWGKSYPQPRLIAWYGDVERTYRYSGVTLTPLPWSATLIPMRERVERAVGVSFNSVLLNYYRDNRDSMGFHSDDEKELGPRPVIASVSLGAERVFILKSKRDQHAKPVRLRLESGSLLLMKGETQANWKHGIEKESRLCGPRVNLTFRVIQ